MAEEGGASFPVSGAYALNRYIAPNFDEHGTTCQVSMEEPVWHATGPVAFLDTLPAATHNPKAGLESGTQPFGRRTTPNVICKTQRDPRLTYSEEQKFWIMYARIIEQRTWPDIKKGFSRLFGVRSRGGLTSVYYRIRKSWHLPDVLEGGPDATVEAKGAVEARASGFSQVFLNSIEYLRSW